MKSRLLPISAVLLIAGAIVFGALAMGSGSGRNVIGMMGAGWRSGGFMGGAASTSGGQISIDRATGIAQQVAAEYSGRSVKVDEVIEFQNNYYASLRETDTGIGAFEILISRNSGAVSPEPGPNMMWNTAYGMAAGSGGMGAMRQTSGAMTVTPDRAASIAQAWLDRNLNGATAKAPDSFHGYYTVDYLKGGSLVGMLSVNGYSGQVWRHTWHGAFIQVKDLGK